MNLDKIKRAVTRKKLLSDVVTTETSLSTFDLILLGLGSISPGVYMIGGSLLTMAGPASICSFLLASLTALLSGLSYAEFGSRISKAGSAYIYSYILMGEFWAFIIGWSIIQEYIIGDIYVVKSSGPSTDPWGTPCSIETVGEVFIQRLGPATLNLLFPKDIKLDLWGITSLESADLSLCLSGTAALATSISYYIDAVTNNQISSFLAFYTPLPASQFFSPYPNFVPFALSLIVTVINCFGIRKPTMMTNVIFIFNMCAFLFLVISGTFFVNFHNWNLEEASIPDHEKNGDGGFMPHGLVGVLRGTSIAFFCFTVFDVLTIAGEETKEPTKSVPIAILASILMGSGIIVLFMSLLSLMQPYYIVSTKAIVAEVFLKSGYPNISKFASVASIICQFTCMTVMFIGGSRIFYTMASDGMLSGVLARVNQRFKTPVYSTLLFGLLSGLLSMFVQLESIVKMMSIGTLFVYTLVNYCALLLHYQKYSENDNVASRPLESHSESGINLLDVNSNSARVKGKSYGTNADENANVDYANASEEKPGKHGNRINEENTNVESVKSVKDTQLKRSFRELFSQCNGAPTKRSENIFIICSLLIIMMTVFGSLIILYLDDYIGRWGIVGVLIIYKISIFVFIFIIQKQPKNQNDAPFQVPFVPWLPFLGIIINIHLMFYLSWENWVRIILWMILGILIYFCYSMHKSNLNKDEKATEYENLDAQETAICEESLNESDPSFRKSN